MTIYCTSMLPTQRVMNKGRDQICSIIPYKYRCQKEVSATHRSVVVRQTTICQTDSLIGEGEMGLGNRDGVWQQGAWIEV
jgi:hypothetical protein